MTCNFDRNSRSGIIAADAPGCPEAYAWTEGEPVKRDVSAGAIMASAEYLADYYFLEALTKLR